MGDTDHNKGTIYMGYTHMHNRPPCMLTSIEWSEGGGAIPEQIPTDTQTRLKARAHNYYLRIFIENKIHYDIADHDAIFDG